MALIEETSRALQASRYVGRRVSGDEEQIRVAVERWGRERWPDARVCHELVVGRGSSRADLAFVGPDRFATVEIKSQYDVTERLINQVAMFRLASPETWIIVDPHHRRDADLVKYLLPSVGLAVAQAPGLIREDEQRREIRVVAEPTEFRAETECMLSLLWVAELHDEAVSRGLWAGKAGSHAKLVKSLSGLSYAEQIKAVCRQLRARDAVWRADPPISRAA